MSFSKQVSLHIGKSRSAPIRVRNKVLLRLFGSIIRSSPVDTGRFRGNWQTNLSTPNLDANSAEDKSGSGSAARAAKQLASAKGDQTIFFTNNLPYGYRLENEGWSGQAPQGMMKVNVTRFANLMEAEARKELRR